MAQTLFEKENSIHEQKYLVPCVGHVEWCVRELDDEEYLDRDRMSKVDPMLLWERKQRLILLEEEEDFEDSICIEMHYVESV